jgi:membrane protease YdiL (CAAX protease family)
MADDLYSTGRAHAWSWPLADWDQMWRPRMWDRKPPRPHDAHVLHLVAILAIGIYANIIANEVLSPAWYIPFNLALLAVTLIIARRAGTTWTSMGLRRDRAARGLKVGIVIVAAIVIGMAIALTVPAFNDVFRDERFIESSIGLLLFHALIRIPLGTALYEEVLFRGVIFGMLVRRYSPITAAVWSSVLFGLWHVLPVLDVIRTNPAGSHFSGAPGVAIAVIAGVISTFVAGLVLLWIRLYANSTLASVLVHIGTNSTAIIAAILVLHFP